VYYFYYTWFAEHCKDTFMWILWNLFENHFQYPTGWAVRKINLLFSRKKSKNNIAIV